jgi:Gpi18-like mannosyltransferase
VVEYPLAQPAETAPAVPPQKLGKSLAKGLFYYGLTSAIAVLGLLMGHYFLERQWYRRTKPDDTLRDAFTGWDGYWYKRIATEGYSYDPNEMSSVAFFPAYPLSGRYLGELTGLPADAALLAVAHLCLALTFVVLLFYVGKRFPKDAASLGGYVLLAFGLWPTTFFGRVTYSESMFLLVTALFLYALEQHWPLLVVGLLAGLATAVRPVGVSLLLPLLLELWRRSGRLGSFANKAVWVVPAACWGILSYMLYQTLAFGTPLAFMQTQSLWQNGPPLPWNEKILALAGLEPVWSVFVPSSSAFWQRHDGPCNPLFSWHIANVVFFVLSAALIWLGARKGWLTSSEILLAVPLLVIPYATRGYEMGMQSAGRFAAVVLPVYLVLGKGFSRLPAPVAAAVLSLCGFFLAAYAALYAAGHRVF